MPVCSAMSLIARSPWSEGYGRVRSRDRYRAVPGYVPVRVSTHVPRRILLTGATGYVGGRLLPRPARRGSRRALPRARPAARGPAGRRRGRAGRRVATRASPRRSTASASPTTSCTRWAAAATATSPSATAAPPRTSAAAASGAGVERVDLPRRPGGRGAPSTCAAATRSPRSSAARPPLVHVRAAMVIGSGSASFLMLEHLVDRLPVMVVPAVDRHAHASRSRSRDVVRHPRRARRPPRPAARGAARRRRRPHLPRDDGAASRASPGRRPPLVVPCRCCTPRLSSYWVGLVTPVELGARAAAHRRASPPRWSSTSRRRRASTTTRSASTTRCARRSTPRSLRDRCAVPGRASPPSSPRSPCAVRRCATAAQPPPARSADAITLDPRTTRRVDAERRACARSRPPTSTLPADAVDAIWTRSTSSASPGPTGASYARARSASCASSTREDGRYVCLLRQPVRRC